jgi:hypothetical protein
MVLQTWRFITLILAALSMGRAFCHTLELPAKLQYDGSLYLTLQNSLAHVGCVVEGINIARRRVGVTHFRLWLHSNTAIYPARNHLLMLRKIRTKLRQPVQIPSIVLVWISRMPSPSSSRAHSRRC